MIINTKNIHFVVDLKRYMLPQLSSLIGYILTRLYDIAANSNDDDCTACKVAIGLIVEFRAFKSTFHNLPYEV